MMQERERGIGARRVELRDVAHDRQLLRDVAIANERTLRELGPLPTGGVPAVPKRKVQPSREPLENESMKLGRMAATAVLGMAGAVAGCASPPVAAPVATSDGAAIKPVTPFDISAFRVYTPADYPQLTPEEMGRRVLRLIEDLNRGGAWTVEHFREVTGLPLAPVPGREDRAYAFTMNLPDSHWYYGLNYYKGWGEERMGESVSYRFGNRTGDRHDKDADMAPVCGVDLDAFDDALKIMGFKMRPKYDQIGRLMSLEYTGSMASVEMLTRSEGYDSEAKLRRGCVKAMFIR